MLCFFVVYFFVVAANDVGDDANLKAEWEAFKAKYGKSYASEAEEHFRMKVYMKKRQEVSAHNEKYANGEVSFYLGMNEFSDLPQKEFVRLRNGYRGKKFVGQPSPRLEPPADAQDSPLPESVDWRVKGAVTPVKNQRRCGSCWAFSATGALEGQYFIKTGKLVSLSEQNLNDCSGDFGNRGCCGGHVDAAFEYIKTGGGLVTEQSYPYTSKDDVCCFNKSNVGMRVSGFVDIENSEEQLKKAVATVGPISVAIDASLPSFKHYMGGMFDEPSCDVLNLDHAVLVVGYGRADGKDYWLVKNSWGIAWGEEGYIRMSRNKNNQCGIATQASYPLVR
ncbi:procathepsin L-like [Ixodes scapularis]|uniref:procathepsin L-like n=1 Tax=Ixodes scapularis TaxID=6945 RepID=UPI001A9E8310|nr:procathepsin L-like [Ixodes scapularis]